jgi:biotin carboxyl carrier protein
MDLDLVRHALAAARQNGYAEVELGAGDASFRARLAKRPKPKAASSDVSPAPVNPVQEVRATLVGYYREVREPLSVGRTIRTGDIVATIEALGIVTDVVSKISGEILEVLVEPGDAVEYGQTLARVMG